MSQGQEIKDVAPVEVTPDELIEVSPSELDDVNGGAVEVSVGIKWTSPK